MPQAQRSHAQRLGIALRDTVAATARHGAAALNFVQLSRRRCVFRHPIRRVAAVSESDSESENLIRLQVYNYVNHYDMII